MSHTGGFGMDTMVSAVARGAACICLVLTGIVGAAPADDYPNKPVRWIVPTGPSGGTDFVARMLAQKVSEALKQSMVVDNRAGASGMLGMEAVARSAPDGYSLGVISVTPFMSALLTRNVSFDITKDFAPVSLLAASPVILVVHPSLPVTTVQGLVALAQAQPGRLNYGSSGTAGITHLAGELFKRRAGINLTHIAYKGTGPAIVDLLAGHVQIGFATPSSIMQHVKAGRLRALAIASEKRSAAAPDVPTFREAGVPDMLVDIWYGMVAPANTPAAIIEKLAQSMAAVVKTADVREKMAAEGSEPIGNTPAEFRDYLKGETEKWTRLAREINLRLE